MRAPLSATARFLFRGGAASEHRASRNMSGATARLGMAPVLLQRWPASNTCPSMCTTVVDSVVLVHAT